jgi:hypothetical protein
MGNDERAENEPEWRRNRSADKSSMTDIESGSTKI